LCYLEDANLYAMCIMPFKTLLTYIWLISEYLDHRNQLTSLLIKVLDLAKGGDMRFNLKAHKHGRFSEATSKFYLCQIALALEACHSISILHRGIDFLF
jgi:serine/threonine protein kinase